MRERGFTLFEMVVVLAILALVLALVPPLLGGSRARAAVKFQAAIHLLAYGVGPVMLATPRLYIRRESPELVEL